MEIIQQKVSELQTISALSEPTSFFMMLDKDDLSQGAGGSVKNAPASAMNLLFWSSSANYEIVTNWQNTYTTVNSNSALWVESGSRISLTYGASLTPNCNDGLSRSITLTGNCDIQPPTNGTDGMVLMLKFVASGASRELTFNSAIKKPTGTTYEATISSGSTRIVHLEYNGSYWMMIRNLEFAP